MTQEVDGKEINAKDVIFDWLANEVRQRDPHEQRTVVAVMDGKTKLRTENRGTGFEQEGAEVSEEERVGGQEKELAGAILDRHPRRIEEERKEH